MNINLNCNGVIHQRRHLQRFSADNFENRRNNLYQFATSRINFSQEKSANRKTNGQTR